MITKEESYYNSLIMEKPNKKEYNYTNIWIKNNNNKWSTIKNTNYLNKADIFELKIEKKYFYYDWKKE